jgi:hypothetical protein
VRDSDLAQTRKLARPIPVLFYGRDYWQEVISFEALLRYGMIAPSDLTPFRYVYDPDQAFQTLRKC